MKIQIDTKSKTIKVEENVSLGELFQTLNRFFPTQEWKEYTLQTNTVIQNWQNPITIGKDWFKDYNPLHQPWEPQPFQQPWQGPYYGGSTSPNGIGCVPTITIQDSSGTLHCGSGLTTNPHGSTSIVTTQNRDVPFTLTGTGGKLKGNSNTGSVNLLNFSSEDGVINLATN